MNKLILLLAIVVLSQNAFGQQALTANAGPDKLKCAFDSVQIGSNMAATGGVPPYTYSWYCLETFSTNSLNNYSIPQPYVLYAGINWNGLHYVLTITDNANNTARDTMYLVNSIVLDGLIDCWQIKGPNDTVQLNGSGSLFLVNDTIASTSYNWQPNIFLSSNTVVNPKSWAPFSVTYTAGTFTTTKGCTYPLATCDVDVYPSPPLQAHAGNDMVRCSGSTQMQRLGDGFLSGWGGKAPYWYQWTTVGGPATPYIDSPNIANPALTAQVPAGDSLQFVLTIGTIVSDTVTVYYSKVNWDTLPCIYTKAMNDTISLNVSGYTTNDSFVTYQWSPTNYLSVSNVANPQCWAPMNTQYATTVVTARGCTYSTPPCDVVIPNGFNAQLDEMLSQVQIVPNPASGAFTISINPKLIGSQYQLLSADGAQVLHGTLDAQQLLVQHQLPAGIYFLKINNEQLGVLSKKLVIAK